MEARSMLPVVLVHVRWGDGGWVKKNSISLRPHPISKFRSSLLGPRSLCVSVLVLLALVAHYQPAFADSFEVKIDTEANKDPKAVFNGGGVGMRSFGAVFRNWRSRGFTDGAGKLIGSLVKNNSGREIQDIHLKLTSKTDGVNPDTFARTSTGGTLFPRVIFRDASDNDVTADGTKAAVRIDFETDKGKGVKAGDSFWMQVPKSVETGGKAA